MTAVAAAPAGPAPGTAPAHLVAAAAAAPRGVVTTLWAGPAEGRYVRDAAREDGTIARIRLYQTEADRKAGADWYHLGQKVYSADGALLDFEGGFSGTREHLDLREDEIATVLVVKRRPC